MSFFLKLIYLYVRMKECRISGLLKKYISGNIHPKEMKELSNLVNLTKDDDLKTVLGAIFDNFEVTEQISFKKKEKQLDTVLKKVTYKQVPFWQNKKIRFTISIAASLLIIISVWSIFQLQSEKDNQSQVLIVKSELVSSQTTTSFIRHIELPDGSHVILNAYSKLSFPERFSEKNREVSLDGEAYFDIKHDHAHPFIIHTGNIKTTVLGTAFNIKAWTQQKNVTVSVTQGKVRVEDPNKIIAVLTMNQEVEYDFNSGHLQKKSVEAEQLVTDWTKTDMEFDHLPLSEVAMVISKRYGVEFSISNQDLANEIIISSFKGTESLDNILNILTAIIPNANYRQNGKQIEFTFNN